MKLSSIFFILIFVVGCASYQSKLHEARQALQTDSPSEAASLLAERAGEEGKDQLLFMLDYGIALHEAGDLDKSNKILIEADRLAEVKDYTSISREAGSLFLNESMIQYKSERFENILINTYLALNFTLQGDFENALVECRRIDTKLYKQKLENEDERKSFYARYLSAMIWEAQKNWDSAYIDFKKAHEIKPGLKYLGKDLIRSAWNARRYEDLKKWQREFPQFKLDEIKKESREKGELVFIYQQGWIPRKRQRPENYRFPHLVPEYSGFTQAVVEIDGKKKGPTRMLYDVGQEAIRTLDADYNYLVTKKIIGFVAKEVAADQIRQKNEVLGAIARIAMHVADQADLRQWSTLPDSLQISKHALSPGDHQIRIWAQGSSGEKKIFDGTVTIKKGQKTFVTERTFN